LNASGFSLVNWNSAGAQFSGTTGTILLLGDNAFTSLASYLFTGIIIPFNATVGDIYIRLTFSLPIDVNFQLSVNGVLQGPTQLLTAGNVATSFSVNVPIVASDILNIAIELLGEIDESVTVGMLGSIQLIS
jgi:hypothetical protein